LAVCGENARRSARARLKTPHGVCPKTVPPRREAQSAKFTPYANPRTGAHRHERVLEQAQEIKDGLGKFAGAVLETLILFLPLIRINR
jgi:hypothetical protein